jgi:polyisoprenoid-binding protein YceI
MKVLGAVFSAVLGVAVLSPASAAAATFEIDAGHSSIVFKVKHLNISSVYGRFNTFAGTFDLDDAGDLTAVNINVTASSVDTGIVRRDDHVRGPDFFEVQSFPTWTFVSTGVTKLDVPGTYELQGNLTAHGVTRQVALQVAKVGETVFQGRQPTLRIGTEGSLVFNRSDFGMNRLLDTVGDEITLLVAFEGWRPVAQ